ncbi:MAG: ABC transporter permease [candidate division Zixibacteria bacterium]|nr:ABC transporter permease [candidate division Zixibacteria bacterium]MDD5425548.1 ABC transporter permease [candidate division Zixibacteria bacterium]
MIKNYFKVALRNLIRHKSFSLINIAGLAVGMALCLMILVYIRYELSYDRFHKDADDIYRVILENNFFEHSDSLFLNIAPLPLAEAMKEDFPEISAVAQFGDEGQSLIRYQDKALFDNRVFYVEPSFFDVFSFPFLAGNPEVLEKPYRAVITRKTAQKIFGDDNPIGKSVRYGSVFDLEISGILDDIPINSHMNFDFLVSMETRRDYWHENVTGGGMISLRGVGDWGILSGKTYFKLRKDCDFNAFEKKFQSWIDGKYTEVKFMKFILQPMTDIHLQGRGGFELENNSDLRYVIFVSVMALLILVISIFNYMNLSTARSTSRMKEVGVRKILGAKRFGLIRQFLGESIFLTLFTLLLSVALVELGLPYFNDLVGIELDFNPLADVYQMSVLIGLALVVGLLAGVYPALFISSYKALDIMSGNPVGVNRKPSFFRNGLVLSQNVIAIGLIICTAVVYQQLTFIGGKDKGYETKNIIAVPARGFRMSKDLSSFTEKLLNHPGILDITRSLTYPFEEGGGATHIWYEGMNASDPTPFFVWTKVDYNFLDFYNIELLEGRNFSRDFPSDSKNAYLLNEAALKALGWETAVGKNFGICERDKGKVIGVIKDFHFNSLHESVQPLAVKLSSNELYSMSIKVEPDNLSNTLEYIRNTWKECSVVPFNYFMFEDRIAEMYRSEQNLKTIFTYTTIIALFLACLGLLGLASYTAERRTREIGIRKVFGATVTSLSLMLSRQYTKWVLLANMVAWPLAYYGMNRWLETYSYRIQLSWYIFVLSGAVALLIAVLTVAFQSIKSALTNPVEVLRHE